MLIVSEQKLSFAPTDEPKRGGWQVGADFELTYNAVFKDFASIAMNSVIGSYW